LLLVRGVVQGVGFRPFVYRLALEEGLAGSSGNDTDGVTIEIEGPRRSSGGVSVRLALRGAAAGADRFGCRSARTPTEALPARPEFPHSCQRGSGPGQHGIPADAATCPDCLRELLDPNDRRYRYPFLNCTNCGPRFTITRRIPYDRPQTSMAQFPMCAACQRGVRRSH
jgi:hydrogenase maturation protein HypF